MSQRKFQYYVGSTPNWHSIMAFHPTERSVLYSRSKSGKYQAGWEGFECSIIQQRSIDESPNPISLKHIA